MNTTALVPQKHASSFANAAASSSPITSDHFADVIITHRAATAEIIAGFAAMLQASGIELRRGSLRATRWS